MSEMLCDHKILNWLGSIQHRIKSQIFIFIQEHSLILLTHSAFCYQIICPNENADRAAIINMFGDGTTLTTTGPVATHDYGNSPLCMYTVCVTVSALGSDGSLCQDTWCQLMPSFVSPGCGSCISLRKAVSPIDEASEVEKGFRLFPNPAEGQTVLEFDAERTNGRLMVYSLQGQLVQDQSGLQGNRFAIDLGELSSGTYLLHFSSDQGDVRQRLVVR